MAAQIPLKSVLTRLPSKQSVVLHQQRTIMLDSQLRVSHSPMLNPPGLPQLTVNHYCAWYHIRCFAVLLLHIRSGYLILSWRVLGSVRKNVDDFCVCPHIQGNLMQRSSSQALRIEKCWSRKSTTFSQECKASVDSSCSRLCFSEQTLEIDCWPCAGAQIRTILDTCSTQSFWNHLRI